MTGVRLDPDVLEIISRLTVRGDCVIQRELMSHQTRIQVNETLALAGGRWDRDRGVHVFCNERPQAVIERLLASQGFSKHD